MRESIAGEIRADTDEGERLHESESLTALCGEINQKIESAAGKLSGCNKSCKEGIRWNLRLFAGEAERVKKSAAQKTAENHLKTILAATPCEFCVQHLKNSSRYIF